MEELDYHQDNELDIDVFYNFCKEYNIEPEEYED